DLDVWALDQLSPGLGWVLYYKVFAIVAAILVSWKILGRKRFASSVLYILGYPLIVLLWKLPIFAFRRWPLLFTFAPVIYRAIITFPATFLLYTLAIFSVLIIMTINEGALLVPAMAGLAVFLIVHLYRSIRNAYGVSIMASLSSALRKFRDSIRQGTFDHAQTPNAVPQAGSAEKPQDPSSLYCLRVLTEIVIDRVGLEVRSRKHDLYLMVCWLYTLSMTTLVFTFQFLALDKLDPSAFTSIPPEASFWEFLGFSLGYLTTAKISRITPVSHIAAALAYAEVACAVLIFVILVFTVLTAARESYKSNMDEFSAELKSIGEALDRRLTEVYLMTSMEVEQFLLRDKAPLVNALRKVRGLPEFPAPAPKPVQPAVSNIVTGTAQTPAA
ncbi:MAG: hypothetical protein ABI833_14840, partial [Acidobacteriota bacterium]